MKENWKELLKSVVDTEIISTTEIRRREAPNFLVTCASGNQYLLRLETQHISLLRQKWALEQLAENGLPCPAIEAYIPPGKCFAEGCLVLSWLDALPAGDILQREGLGSIAFSICCEMGKLLRQLHDTSVVGTVPDYVFTSTRHGAYDFAQHCVRLLMDESLVDTRFAARFMQLVEKYIIHIPDPAPLKLYFSDMHFANVLFYDENPPRIAGFIDVEELGVGWPLWDFTNWECWGIRFYGGWTREYIMQGYGPLDIDMYRMAVMVRLARPATFTGSTRQQIERAVIEQDMGAFDLDLLYH